MKVLLVEDNQATAAALSEALTLNHYSVDNVGDGEMALKLAEAFSYDLILLDIVIPKIDGLHVCQHLRSEGCQVPILLLTAKDSSGDRVLGLDAGADDYLVKPFDFEELLARMRALLRRGSATLPPTLTWEKLHFSPGTSKFTYTGQFLHLTPKEYGLLELFISNPTRIFSRSVIIDHLWTSDTFPGEEAVNTHMKTLRQKLKAAGASSDFIETVYGMGYRLRPLPEQPPPPETPETPESDRPGEWRQNLIEGKLAEALEQLKGQFQSYFNEQLAVLEQVAIALAQNNLTSELQHQGKQEAHKLAGSLGIYGFEEGSLLARQLEALLASQETLETQHLGQFNEWLSQLKKETQTQAVDQPVTVSTEILLQEKQRISISAASSSNSRRLLVIDDDDTLTELLKLEGQKWDLQVDSLDSIAAARVRLLASKTDTVPGDRPALILLGLTFPDANEAGLNLLKELAQQQPEIPVVVLTRSGEIENRVKVAQSGVRAFLQKPMLPETIFSVIEHILHTQEHEARVMVVDDDRATLAALTTLLQSHHLKVTTLDNPQQFWEKLTTCTPDLLLLDIEMPDFNGIELCQAVRTDPQWTHLPILVLTEHQDSDLRHQATAAGADEYISKPFNETDLLIRILSRLARARL
jgi:DNA-binding response OmpR family regulator/HPt (histidine-containing phosphotransfer) domain-containing protein